MPMLVLTDVGAAKDFYHNAFGFSTDRVLLHNDGCLAAAEIGWPGGGVLLVSTRLTGKHMSPASAPSLRSIIRLLCDDVDGLFDHAVGSGAIPVSPPTDQFWGARNCTLADPYGHLWLFAKLGGEYRPPPEGV